MEAKNITFLLGAGASYDAGIPVSKDMVDKVEYLVKNSDKWMQYRELYYYLKSSIQYSKGIFGKFDYLFNIEDLLVVLSEIEKRDENIMYPYIGNWNMRLIDLAGNNFNNISNLKQLIKDNLSEWIKPKEGYQKADYYKGFIKFHNELAKTLKIFTLNYDLCFERIIIDKNDEIIVELGFSNRIWHYKNFDILDSEQRPTHFALYKLHGSINWKKIDNGKIHLEDDPISDAELIFGIPYKLTSSDPYFFYSTEFRKTLLDNDLKILVCIGYSFFDDYLNLFISQAINEKENMIILSVTYCNDNEIKDKKTEIVEKLKCNPDKVIIYNKGAKNFLQNKMSISYFDELIPSNDDAPF